jgi:glycosyltransferase involved in cell wall biosynthesis
MLVSVVIPVYRADEYLREAVDSALRQAETGEIILVEDGSPDGSLAICQELVEADPRVKLVRHPGGENRGAAASRNLGIRTARCDVVAFLDADDYYLENRFAEADRVFEQDRGGDGVYEAVGACFQDSQARDRWRSWGHEELITMRERLAPEDLFRALIAQGRGWLHLDGLVVKRSAFERSGYFFEHLRLHQDSALFLQLAATCRLLPGRLGEPVAMRRVHAHNRISGANPVSRALYFRTLFHWAVQQKLDEWMIESLFDRYLYFWFSCIKREVSLEQRIGDTKNMLVDILQYPRISLSSVFRRLQNGFSMS